MSTCFKIFLDLDDRLMDTVPNAITELLHENCNGDFVPTIPNTGKYRNFLIDMMEFRMQHFFQ